MPLLARLRAYSEACQLFRPVLIFQHEGSAGYCPVAGFLSLFQIRARRKQDRYPLVFDNVFAGCPMKISGVSSLRRREVLQSILFGAG